MNATDLQVLRNAAQTTTPVSGLTHDFYRYPARFSPVFASTAIRLFSRPGDLVFDPFMGGGTTVVEGLVAGRRVVGSDLNSLAVFLSTVKTTPLSSADQATVHDWFQDTIPTLSYRIPTADFTLLSDARNFNLTLPRARPIKKSLAVALGGLPELPTEKSRDFARCVLLRTAQWALDNRKRAPSLAEFRSKLANNVQLMLSGVRELATALRWSGTSRREPALLQEDAAHVCSQPFFQQPDNAVDLVVCSPPYPGIHVLYHRWQVNGRRETPAPYWIADCHDGQGGSYYTFGDRRADSLTGYFDKLRQAFRTIRAVMKENAYMVQMVSFNDRERQLQRYLYAMRVAGFEEVKQTSARRIWREVPNRKWHATLRGQTGASREVVLIHRAVRNAGS